MAIDEAGQHALNARSLFDETLGLLKAHPLPLLVPLVLVGIMSSSGGMDRAGMDSFVWHRFDFIFFLPFFFLMLVVLAVLIVALVVLHALASLVTTQAAMDAGEGPPDLQRAWATMRPQLAPGVLTYVLYLVLVLAGFAFLILPGVFLAAAWAPVLAVVLHERVGGPEALRRAWRLTDGHRMDLFLLILGAVGVAVAGSIVFGWFPIVGSALSSAIGGAAMAFNVVLGVVFYRRKAAAAAVPEASETA